MKCAVGEAFKLIFWPAPKLQALVDILPQTTAIVDHATNKKLSANWKFFVGAQMGVSL